MTKEQRISTIRELMEGIECSSLPKAKELLGNSFCLAFQVNQEVMSPLIPLYQSIISGREDENIAIALGWVG